MEIQTRPGLAEPVRDAQRVFRAVLEAMSRPGNMVRAQVAAASPYAREAAGTGMSRGMTALALALCDQDTPIWLDGASDGEETRHHLRFHCGCRFTARPEEAAFALIAQPERMPRLYLFGQGTPEYPDRSATLVLNAKLGGDSGGQRFELFGPGVKAQSQACRIGGLPGWFPEDWRENHARYPLGLDLIFVDDSPLAEGLGYFLILALPRSVSLEPLHGPQRLNREAAACMSQ